MKNNNTSSGYNTRPRYQQESFSSQLKKVFGVNHYAYYNHLVCIWKIIGEKTTISVYPILLELSKLFAQVEWLGKYGGLKEAYETFVPEKYLGVYRKAMYSGIDTMGSNTNFDKKMKSLASNISSMDPFVLDKLLLNANAAIALREEIFYLYFPVSFLDKSTKCHEIWKKLPENAKKILCFDKKSLTEISMFLKVETKSLFDFDKDTMKAEKSIVDKNEIDETVFEDNLREVKKDNNDDKELNTKLKGDETETASSSISSEEDFSDFELDENDKNDTELLDRLRKFNDEILEAIEQPAKDNKTNEKPTVTKENTIVTPSKNQKLKKRKKKRGRRKNFWDEGDDVNTQIKSDIYNTILSKAFTDGRERKGPRILREEEDKERENVHDANVLESFNEEDFVIENQVDISTVENQDLAGNFVEEYNALSQTPGNSVVQNGNGKENSVEKLPEKRGFFDEEALKEYQNVNEFGFKNEKNNVEIEENDKEEETKQKVIEDTKEDSDPNDETNWKLSLLRNEELRKGNDSENLTNPNEIGANNFDSKGELLATLLHSRKGFLSKNSEDDVFLNEEDNFGNQKFDSGQEREKEDKNELKFPGLKLGFIDWKCSGCGASNEKRLIRCKTCKKQNRVLAEQKPREGVVTEFSKKKGFGKIEPMDKGYTLSVHKRNVWSGDACLFVAERVSFRKAKGKNEAICVVPIDVNRRMLMGDCVKLNPEGGGGWIRLRKNTRHRADVFFDLMDYDSGQKPKEGMSMVFKLDFSFFQPRARNVRPLLEKFENDEEFDVGEKQSNSMFSTKMNVFEGEIVSWSQSFGFAQKKNGPEKILVPSNAAITAKKTFFEGDKIEFSIETDSHTQTGHISAKYVVKIDPSEIFKGRIKRLHERFGFIKVDVDWNIPDVYFNIVDSLSDFFKIHEGDCVQFILSIGPKGLCAKQLELLSEIRRH